MMNYQEFGKTYRLRQTGLADMTAGVRVMGIMLGLGVVSGILGGCLLHVWNHALFKALLFLSAGSVLLDVADPAVRERPDLSIVFLPRTAGSFAVALPAC